MNYFYSLKDTFNYTHSIDNLTITYFVKAVGTTILSQIIRRIQLLADCYKDSIVYWENLNCPACSKYQWYQNRIHLDDGIFISIGHYSDYDKDKAEFYCFPLIKVEVNPNKHFEKSIFKDFLDILNNFCYEGRIDKYDYAIDIPLSPSKVEVLGSNKEKGLYKGTRYYGQRNKNGYCKIYDKKKESGLLEELTRVEHTFSTVKTTKNKSFEKIYISDDSINNLDALSDTNKVIVELCTMLMQNNIPFDNVIDKLDKRKRKVIMENIEHCSYRLLEFNQEIHDNLLEYCKEKFNIREMNGIEEESDNIKWKKIIEQDYENLPFE